jgi:hypothetical protein
MEKEIFVFLLWASFVGYSIILLWGVNTTRRSGMPSISRMLADDVDLTIFFVLTVAMYGVSRLVASWTVEDQWVHAAGALQILFLVLVAFVTLEDHEDLHYGVAGGAVFWSVVRESMLVCKRKKRARKVKRWTPWDVLNIALIVATVACGLSFFLLAVINSEYNELHMAALEYACFWLIVILPLFQAQDFMVE